MQADPDQCVFLQPVISEAEEFYKQLKSCGTSLLSNWSPFEILINREHMLVDVLWVPIVGYIAVSQRAADVLRSLCQHHVEFLPLKYRQAEYYIVNVLTLLNGVDPERSEVLTDDNDKIRMFMSYAFIPNCVEHVPIFKVTNDPAGYIFVSDELRHRILEEGLTGFQFMLAFDSDRSEPIRLFEKPLLNPSSEAEIRKYIHKYHSFSLTHLLMNYVNRDSWLERIRASFPGCHVENMTEFNYGRCFHYAVNMTGGNMNLLDPEMKEYIRHEPFYRVYLKISVLRPLLNVTYVSYSLNEHGEEEFVWNEKPFKAEHDEFQRKVEAFAKEHELIIVPKSLLGDTLPCQCPKTVYEFYFEESS